MSRVVRPWRKEQPLMIIDMAGNKARQMEDID